MHLLSVGWLALVVKQHLQTLLLIYWSHRRYLLCENGTGVAPVFIIFNAGLTAILVWLPYVNYVICHTSVRTVPGL
jgi:hypothetical protein